MKQIFCKDCKFFYPECSGLEYWHPDECISNKGKYYIQQKERTYIDPVNGPVHDKEIRVYYSVDPRKQNKNMDCAWYEKMRKA